MKADVLAVGAMMLVGGIGLAIWADSQADPITRIVDVVQYNLYKNLALFGFAVAALGAGIMLYGFASNSAPSLQTPSLVTMSTPSGQAAFCQYCGAKTRALDVYCPICGRIVPRR